MTIVLIAALVSVVMGFVFALVESALGRVTRHRVVALAEEGHAGASALGRIVDNHATALMVLTFLRVGAEMTAAVLVTVAATRASPLPQRQTMQAAIASVLSQADVRDRLQAMNFTPVGEDVGAAEQRWRTERERLGQVIRTAGITLE